LAGGTVGDVEKPNWTAAVDGVICAFIAIGVLLPWVKLPDGAELQLIAVTVVPGAVVLCEIEAEEVPTPEAFDAKTSKS
jgi:hypothetical protein